MLDIGFEEDFELMQVIAEYMMKKNKDLDKILKTAEEII